MAGWKERGIGECIERALKHAKKIDDPEAKKAIEELIRAMRSMLAEIMEK